LVTVQTNAFECFMISTPVKSIVWLHSAAYGLLFVCGESLWSSAATEKSWGF